MQTAPIAKELTPTPFWKALFKPSPKKKAPAAAPQRPTQPAEPKPASGKKPPSPAKRAPQALKGVRKRFGVGIDIGSQSIKWVALGERNGGVEIIACGEHPIDTLSEQGRIEGLKQASKRNGWRGPFNSAIPLSQVSLELIKLPNLPPAEVPQAIRWQIEPSLPKDLRFEDVSLDYMPIDSLAQGSERTALAVYSAKNKLKTHVRIFERAGLKLSSVDVDAFALAALMPKDGGTAGEISLLFDFGKSQSSMIFLLNGEVLRAEPITLHGDALSYAISEQLGVSLEDAEALKRRYGLGSENDEPSEDAERRMATRQLLTSRMEQLMVQFMHTFMGVQQSLINQGVRKIARVYLSGGSSALPGLEGWLSNRLGVPVSRVNPFKRFPPVDEIAGAVNALEPARFAVAAGVASREIKRAHGS